MNKNDLKHERNLDIQLRFLEQTYRLLFKNRSAKCPFHSDETPSLGFYINQWGYVKFRCYGECGYDEDIYGLICRFDNCSFYTAYAKFKNYFEKGANDHEAS